MRLIGLAITLAIGLLAAPLAAEGQTAGKVYRLGFLRWQDGPDAGFEALRQGLRELGWIEGQNVAFEYRWAAVGKTVFLFSPGESLPLEG